MILNEKVFENKVVKLIEIQLFFWSFLCPTLFEQLKIYGLIAQAVALITNKIKHKIVHKTYKWSSGSGVVAILLWVVGEVVSSNLEG